jgi:hypothetical protein
MALCLPCAAARARAPAHVGGASRRSSARAAQPRRAATRAPLRVAATATVEPPRAAPPPVTPPPAATPLDTLQSSIAALSTLAANPVRAQYASAQAVRPRRAFRTTKLAYTAARNALAQLLTPCLAWSACEATGKRKALQWWLRRIELTRALPPPHQLRFAYFLTQGVVNARLVLRTNLDAVAIARTLVRVLTAAPGAEPLTGSDLLGRPLSGPEAEKMSAFWEENLRAVIGLFRDEMANIEAGVYKMPYDLSPLGAPAPPQQLPEPLGGLLAALPLPPLPQLASQWNPLSVAATAAAYMRDQAAVAARRDAKNGTEVQSALDPAAADRYPKCALPSMPVVA